MLYLVSLHAVAASATFILLWGLERAIYGREPTNTVGELLLTSVLITLNPLLNVLALTVTFILLWHKPRKIVRAGYWPIELIRLFTRKPVSWR